MIDVPEFLKRANGLHEKIAHDVPQIARGKVWCKRCGAEMSVNGADCLRNGWPKCCGHTMTIDHPDTWDEERSNR